MLTRFLLLIWVSFNESNSLKMSVRTNHISVLSSGVVFECDLEGASWAASNFPREWRIPPSAQVVIKDGVANSGFIEDLSDAPTLGIIRMTTPELDWSIENGDFQCLYRFSSSSLNATRDILFYMPSKERKYDDSEDKCSIILSTVLPEPVVKSVLITSNDKTENVTVSDERVTETLSTNNDAGRTFKYELAVATTNLHKGDSVEIQVKVGPTIETQTCRIKDADEKIGIAALTFGCCDVLDCIAEIVLFILIINIYVLKKQIVPSKMMMAVYVIAGISLVLLILVSGLAIGSNATESCTTVCLWKIAVGLAVPCTSCTLVLVAVIAFLKWKGKVLVEQNQAPHAGNEVKPVSPSDVQVNSHKGHQENPALLPPDPKAQPSLPPIDDSQKKKKKKKRNKKNKDTNVDADEVDTSNDVAKKLDSN